MSETTEQRRAAEERRIKEEAYRHAVGLVRVLAAELNIPCPIVTREERRSERLRGGESHEARKA